MRAHFRPEFLNRVDETIVFHALAEEHLKQIVDIQLGRVRARLADRQIQLELTDRARLNLVRTGYDPAYGARPLKRAIQKENRNPAWPPAGGRQGPRRPVHPGGCLKRHGRIEFPAGTGARVPVIYPFGDPDTYSRPLFSARPSRAGHARPPAARQ